MLNNIKREFIKDKAIIEALKDGLKISDKEIEERVIKSGETFFEPKPLKFNAQNRYEDFISLLESAETDIDFFNVVKGYVKTYSETLELNNAISKSILKNKINKLTREIDANMKEENLYASIIGFTDLININFETGKEYEKTNCFVDLYNKKSVNNRVDVPVKAYKYATKIISSNMSVDKDYLSEIVTGGIFEADITSAGYSKENSITYAIEYDEEIYANRLAFDLLYISSGKCEIEIFSDEDSSIIHSEKINNEHVDIIFNHSKISKIHITVSNDDEETFTFGMSKFQLYNDIYEESSYLCTKPIPVHKKAFKIDVDKIELTDTKCYILVGLVKGKEITWKDCENSDVFNYLYNQEEVDEVIVLCKLKGTKSNTPIINSITVRKDVNDFTVGLYDEYDFDGDINKGKIIINLIGNKTTSNAPLLPGKGRITINLNSNNGGV